MHNTTPVYKRTDTPHMMHSHIQSHKWVILCTSTQKTRKMAEMYHTGNLLGPDCTGTQRHREVCRISIHAFIVGIEWGTISDTRLKV